METAVIRKCVQCGEEKGAGDFYKRGKKRNKFFGRCKSCLSQYSAFRYEKNKERILEVNKKWRGNNRDKMLQLGRDWRYKNKWATRLMTIQSHANKSGYKPCYISVDELQKLFTGRCMICGVPECECSGSLHIDHDHETGKFRGFLCGSCNRALGLCKDNKHILEAAIRYLEDSEYKEIKETENGDFAI